MKKIVQYLLEHNTLTRQVAKETMLQIGKGVYNDSEIAAFVTIYLMRSITIEELEGFQEALMEMCTSITFEQTLFTDIVGTGGDGKNTFNISTLSCFVLAGAGYNVVKHGNYGVSSISGSSNVMEYLGYKFSNQNEKLQKELTETSICFLHAPLFHSALKNVADVRKNLGIRTFFNMLGPIVNPATPSHTVIGVYNLEVARYYNYFMQRNKTIFSIVHTMDGFDEISLTDDCKIITRQGEQVFSPEYLGKRTVKNTDINGGTSIEDAAKIFMDVLKGNATWAQNAVVFSNAAIAIQNLTEQDYSTCFQLAIESVESGKACKQFNKLIALQK
jgi:anthranilate phosphoribosyltransferase